MKDFNSVLSIRFFGAEVIQLANSELIPNLKSAKIKEIIKDGSLFYAIDSNEIQDIKQANKLIYKHIFPYHRIDGTNNSPCNQEGRCCFA